MYRMCKIAFYAHCNEKIFIYVLILFHVRYVILIIIYNIIVVKNEEFNCILSNFLHQEKINRKFR